ncbi:MAG: nickel/cobalt transporter [Hyphomicrobium sp.]|nr:nickel/cobalt transporter [Hyphomicrobium sp.]
MTAASRTVLLAIVLALAVLPTVLAATHAAVAADGIVVAQGAPPITSDRALTGGRTQPGPAAEPGFVSGIYNWILTQQHRLNRELADGVKALKAGGGISAAWLLIAIGFTYGVLHAAGPGHGKAIISSYVLANEKTVRRGIMLSFLAALFQALSAIVLVGILAVALNMTSMAMRTAEHWIEVVSWGLVAAVGAWLLYGQVRQILARRAAGSVPAHSASSHANADKHHDCGCAHHGTHDHNHSHAHAHAHSHAQASHAPVGHAHDHHGSHDDCCGHAHMPDPKDLQGDLTWTKALAIAGSVGIRPCTGAILVLIFALSQGLFWAGVLATFAMALGTAITVSVLASMALGSRELAARLGGEGSGWAQGVSTAAGILGSLLVLVMGSVLFVGTLQNGPGPL